MGVILVFPDSEDVVAVKGYVVEAAAAHAVVADCYGVVAYAAVVAAGCAVGTVAGNVVGAGAVYAVVADYEVADLYAVAGDCYAALQPGLVQPQGVAEAVPADELLNPVWMRAQCYVVVIHD